MIANLILTQYIKLFNSQIIVLNLAMICLSKYFKTEFTFLDHTMYLISLESGIDTSPRKGVLISFIYHF